MQPGMFYHIYNHANGSENLFRSDENYRFFLQQWGKYIEPIAETYAYCLMPNHFHFLIKIKDEKEVQANFKLEEGTFGKFKTFQKLISKQFANLFSSYTQAYNKMYDRKGSLFIPNFKKKEITSEDYLTNIIFYIHHNPVHHGFTEHIEDWPHSSYHSLLSERTTKLQCQATIEWFGNKAELKKFHQQSLKNLHTLEMKFT